MQLKETVASLQITLNTTMEALKQSQDQAQQLDREMREIKCRDEALTAERDRLKEHIEQVLQELSLVKAENRSLRESCRVLELENADLMASEKRLKEILGNRIGTEEISSQTASGIETVNANRNSTESAIKMVSETAQESLVADEDSEDEREAHR